MKLLTFFSLFVFLFFCNSFSLYSYIPPHIEAELGEEPPATYRSDCARARASKDLTINKVRARVMTGGDKWWDLSGAHYVVPVPPTGGPQVSAAFAGALWVGGFDNEGNLKLAAQTYRTANRNEWWPGPLNEDGSTFSDQCKDWDIIFRVTSEDVRQQRKNVEQFSQIGMSIPQELIPENILYWPAIGNPFFTDKYNFDVPSSNQGLAPFFDFNNDGIYNPSDGDFPILGLDGCEASVNSHVPDEMLFWVFNDAGGVHTNSGGDPGKFEFRTQAFAFDAGNELDYLTFYRYQLVNKGPSFIDSTHIGLWLDFDLGCPFNDFIGSYPDLDLGFFYNMDEYGGINQTCDCGSIPAYCGQIPAIGVNILRGPKDKNGNDLGLTYFIYHNNPGGFSGPAATTDPTNATEFYRFLTGRWRDSRPMTYGDEGYQPVGGTIINHAFPGNPSDPDAWTMCSVDEIQPADRRVILSSGPFRLEPGSVTEIVYGVPFVLDLDYPCPDLTRLFEVTKKTRTLFDQCFQMELRGPDAPDLIASRMNDAFAIELSNDVPGSNNRNLDYREKGIFMPDDIQDEYYTFEGYQVFQLRSRNLPVSRETFTNPNLARQVFQSDIQNEVDIIYNWTRYENPNYYLARPIFIPELMVDGANTGLEHSFIIDRDMFDESGDGRLEAGKNYYYTVIAYAHNEYRPFEWRNPEVGQGNPYLSSTKNIKVYTLNLDNDLLPQNQDGRAVMASEENEIQNSWNFSLPGNPGKDHLRVVVSQDEELIFQIRVISMDGQLMYSSQFSGGEYNISSESWAAGVYAVEMINISDQPKSRSLLWVKK